MKLGKLEGAGGTPGGIGDFFMGLLMSCGGAYMILDRLTVSSHFYLPWFDQGRGAFGPVFSVFLIGLFFLFFNGRSWLGWGLTAAGLMMIFWGVISSLELYFRPTSMLHTIIMFGMLFGGMGLVARSLQPYANS